MALVTAAAVAPVAAAPVAAAPVAAAPGPPAAVAAGSVVAEKAAAPVPPAGAYAAPPPPPPPPGYQELGKMIIVREYCCPQTYTRMVSDRRCKHHGFESGTAPSPLPWKYINHDLPRSNRVFHEPEYR